MDSLRQQIPYYLTASPEQKKLVEELQLLWGGASKGYFVPKLHDPFLGEMLQGDGWQGLKIVSIQTGTAKPVKAVVVSNTCDISPENERALPVNVSYAPLVKVKKLEERFLSCGIRTESIQSRLAAIRSQSVTSMFYLPAEHPLDEEYVVLLDDMHSMPIGMIDRTSQKLFTLSMAGFYMFLFKLSVHFCRFQENVSRGFGRVK